MTSAQDVGPLSDTEGGEKPVREQLKKAHITNAAKNTAAASNPTTELTNSNSNGNHVDEAAPPRGRLSKKRSHEEVEGDSQNATEETTRLHTRKRSRDSTVEEDVLNNGQRKTSGENKRNGEDGSEGDMESVPINGKVKSPRAATPERASEKRSEDAVETISSPKTKRSRLHSATDEASATLPAKASQASPDEVAAATSATQSSTTDARSEPAAAPARGPPTKIPSTSGFANASAVSPFGALAGSKSPSAEPQTSASAFASSGFSALSGSSTSGFGAVGKETGGFGSGGSFATGAKSPAKSKENETAKPATSSAFGGALGQQSAFSSTTAGGSGFGTVASSGFGSGGFGRGLGGTGFSSLGKGGLSSFASGKSTPLASSSKPTRAFGAPADDEEEGEDDEDDDKSGAKSPLSDEADKQHPDFYEQQVETGEEGEKTEFTCRAKLYNFSAGPDGNKEWRERGLGMVRFNVKKAAEGEEPKGRLLMRLQGSHRVVLNTPVTKGLKFGTPKGDPPEGGFMYFMGTIDGKESLELLQLKMKQVNALDLHSSIAKLQEQM